MKRTLKKTLILLAVIVTAMLVMSFMASAAEDCGDGLHSVGTRVVAPTCEEAGYTESYCTICGKVFGTSDPVAELGHDYENGEWKYRRVGDEYYLHTSICANGCGTSYDEELAGNKIKYYRVTLFNPWVIDEAEEDVTYTTLAKTYKTEIIQDDKGKNGKDCAWFVEADTTVADYIKENYDLDYSYTEVDKDDSFLWYLINRNLIYRNKDKAFGKYDFKGWTLTEQNENATEFFNIDTDTVNSSVTGNYAELKLYAAFEGDEEVYYNIQYYDVYGVPSTRNFKVRHGESADDSIFVPDENGNYLNAPKKAEDAAFYYEFKGWDKSIEHVYGDAFFRATFNSVPKAYTYVYCDENGVPLKDENGNQLSADTLAYGATSSKYTNSYIEKLVQKPKDRTYIYLWSGKWKNRDNVFEYNHSNMTPSSFDKDSRYGEEAVIYLVPVYTRKLVVYNLVLTISLPDYETDYDRYLNGIIVQIVDSNGQLVKSGNAVRSGNKAVFTCNANDSLFYNITALTENGKYSASYTIDRQFVYNLENPTIAQDITLTLDQDYVNANTCHCICHNALFRGIWARVLNILYKLFKVKYVCCYDMYATLGDLLTYTK